MEQGEVGDNLLTAQPDDISVPVDDAQYKDENLLAPHPADDLPAADDDTAEREAQIDPANQDDRCQTSFPFSLTTSLFGGQIETKHNFCAKVPTQRIILFRWTRQPTRNCLHCIDFFEGLGLPSQKLWTTPVLRCGVLYKILDQRFRLCQ